jgi:hypothetical protein
MIAGPQILSAIFPSDASERLNLANLVAALAGPPRVAPHITRCG